VFSDERRDYINRYRLTRVSEEVFRLALEDWAIWTRWERAFKAGHTTEQTHPALPEDATRHIQIESILAEKLRAGNTTGITRSAKFLILNPPVDRSGIQINLLVQWSEPLGPLNESIWAEYPAPAETKHMS
jgi:hypothetical protein